MSISRTAKQRVRRIAMGAIAIVSVVFGVAWLAQKSTSNLAIARTPIGSTEQKGGHAVSSKAPVSKDAILRRFSNEQHEEFMRRAITNSRKAGVEYKTGGAFGAVIVTKDGEVIADGLNHVVAENDPSWHAEVHAIRQACALLKKPKLEGCVLYSSSEPCPMCLATAYWAGLDGIIYGATVADSTKYGGFDDGFIYTELAKPIESRSIPEINMARPEAVKVWQEYSEQPGDVAY